MDGPAGHPDDVVLVGPHHRAAGQLRLEHTAEDDPPVVEVGVPVRTVAAAGWAGDQGDQLALVGDDALGPRRRLHLGDHVGDTRVQHVGPAGVGGGRRNRSLHDEWAHGRIMPHSRRGEPTMRPRLVLTAALLLAFGSPAHAQAPRSGGELVFVVGSESPSYDAHREETFGLIHPAAPHYSTLLRVDPTDTTGTKVVGDLAESWTTSKHGLTYTFKVRRGVKFHDGSTLAARDVKASYGKIITPPPGVMSLRRGQYSVVEAFEAPDAETVIFRLKHPSAG